MEKAESNGAGGVRRCGDGWEDRRVCVVGGVGQDVRSVFVGGAAGLGCCHFANTVVFKQD